MSITSITKAEKEILTKVREKFDHKAKLSGYSAAAASFLLIGALVIITCGCLCLMLPGVNVVYDVILPAVVPGIILIALSIPFIVFSVKMDLKNKDRREELVLAMLKNLDDYGVPEMPKKMRHKFILKNFLDWREEDDGKLTKNTNWKVEYQGKILSDIKDRMGEEKKDRNKRQEIMAKALDKARGEINKKDK